VIAFIKTIPIIILKVKKIFALISVLFLFGFAPIDYSSVSVEPKEIPFLMLDNNGYPQQVSLNSFQGRNIILNFWASWCEACTAEMPSLDNFANKYTEELKLTIIPVSVDKNGFDAVNGFYHASSINYLGKYIDSSQSLMQSYRVSMIPTTIILDSNGVEIDRISGFIDWDRDKVVKYITKVIQKKATNSN
jgi:thiol-disulfide isomerase/thioredoxin